MTPLIFFDTVKKKEHSLSEKLKEKAREKITTKAYLVQKKMGFLAIAKELEIKNGIVVSEKILSLRGEDMPAMAVGICSKELWKQYQNEDGDIESKI